MNDKALKRCPDCGGALTEVYAEANYGRVLLLDQCGACGGVWFDRWELYFLKDSSLEALGTFDAASFSAENQAEPASESCPVCVEPLTEFTDPMLPTDGLIKRCAGCGGIWLNRGALGSYGRHREKRKGGRPQKGAASGTPAPSKAGTRGVRAARRLGSALDAGTLLAPERPDSAALDSGPITPREFAVDVAFLAVQALLRLVFKI